MAEAAPGIGGDEVGAFERSVYRRDFARAVSLLHGLLANFDQRGGALPALDWLRLAGAVTQLLLDPRFTLSPTAYRLLCGSNRALGAVFACTDYGNGDHVIGALADTGDPANLRFADRQVLMKCLLCYLPDSRYRLDLRQVATRFPELAAPVLIGLLGADLLSRTRIELKLNDLLAQRWEFLHDFVPALPQVVSLSGAWMNCSYATAAGKHAVKGDLNRMIRNWLPGEPTGTGEAPRPARERPRLLVVLEIFTAGHAMVRCFGRVIERLPEQFEVIGLAPSNCIDDQTAALFPQVERFDVGEAFGDFASLLQRIRALAPDMIYYPSLGMANYAIALANLRLAPVQCFSLGHPATSMSEHMDYVLVQEQDFTDAGIYSETVVITGNDTSPTVDSIRDRVPRPVVRAHAPELQIAVSSKHMKINHSFLGVCRRIADTAARPVRFHFFPAVTGYLHAFVAHEIERLLPGSRVYATTDFAAYLHTLGGCDLRLGTFPFGGANTNMDCFGLGIPFVALDGEQPHAHADAAQLQQAGLPQLVAADVEAYVATALRLIDDDAERVRLSRHMLALDGSDFFARRARERAMSFPRTLRWLHDNHDRLQQSGERVWPLAAQGLA